MVRPTFTDLTLKFEPFNADVIQSVSLDGNSYPKGIGWMPLESFCKVAYRDLNLLGNSVTWNGETPVIGLSRDQFEDEFGKVRYRLGVQPTMLVKIGLPHGLFVQVSTREGIQPEGQTVAYVDIPMALRDEVWANACQNILKSSKRARDIELGLIKGTRGGSNSGTTPSPQ